MKFIKHSCTLRAKEIANLLGKVFDELYIIVKLLSCVVHTNS